MNHRTRARSRAVLLLALATEVLVAGWWRWSWTTAPIQTPFDYGTGHVAVVSENWRRAGALRQHFLPVMSTDPNLPEWPFRTPFAQEYSSVPPLAFILHYAATRALPAVEPVLLGKLLAQALIAASVLVAGWFLCDVFGFWPALVGLSFVISGVPCILWFASGYFAVNVALAVHLVLVSWCAAIALAALDDGVERVTPSAAGGFIVGAGLAFAGAFSDYLPVFANAVAVAGFTALAAVCWRERPAGRRVLLASAAGVAAGTGVAGGTTAVLYGLQMGFSRYREAITTRVEMRTGHATLAEHFDVIRRQMLTAWPAGLLVILAVVLVAVAAWCATEAIKARGRREGNPALVTLFALAVAFIPTFLFHFRAVSYVSLHWWFAGEWMVGWAIALCALVWLARGFAESVARSRRLAIEPCYATACAAVLVMLIAANVSFAAAQVATDPRAETVELYRWLGKNLPADPAPLVVADLAIDTPGLFEDFPYATAYLRRPVIIREHDARLRLPATDAPWEGRIVRFGGEDADPLLRRRGGELYIAYDLDATRCLAPGVPLAAATAGAAWVHVGVCRASAVEYVDHPDAILRRVNAGDPCAVPLPPPTGFHVVANDGGVVVLAWTPVPVRRLLNVLEAGSGPGRVDLLVKEVGWASTYKTDAKPGTYYARMRSRNACGAGTASDELIVVVK
jgi:hypothetical protein